MFRHGSVEFVALRLLSSCVVISARDPLISSFAAPFFSHIVLCVVNHFILFLVLPILLLSRPSFAFLPSLKLVYFSPQRGQFHSFNSIYNINSSGNEVFRCYTAGCQPCCCADVRYEPRTSTIDRPSNTYRDRRRHETRRNRHGARPRLLPRIHHRGARRQSQIRLHAEKPYCNPIDLCRSMQEDGRRVGLRIHAESGGEGRRGVGDGRYDDGAFMVLLQTTKRHPLRQRHGLCHQRQIHRRQDLFRLETARRQQERYCAELRRYCFGGSWGCCCGADPRYGRCGG